MAKKSKSQKVASKKEPSLARLRSWGRKIAQFKHALGEDGLFEALQAMSAVEKAYVSSMERIHFHRPKLLKKPKLKFKPVYLKRPGRYPILTEAILREDGVHFIDHEGKEMEEASYPSIEAMNEMLRKCGFDVFAE